MYLVLGNVSFGILVVTPFGWLLMALVICLEALILSKVLRGVYWQGRIALASLVTNAISGICGVVISHLHNGGWWMVVWVPWVSANEVGAGNLSGFIPFALVTCILSLAIESGTNLLLLRGYPRRQVFKGTIYSNLISACLLSMIIIFIGRLP